VCNAFVDFSLGVLVNSCLVLVRVRIEVVSPPVDNKIVAFSVESYTWNVYIVLSFTLQIGQSFFLCSYSVQTQGEDSLFIT